MDLINFLFNHEEMLLRIFIIQLSILAILYTIMRRPV